MTPASTSLMADVAEPMLLVVVGSGVVLVTVAILVTVPVAV